MTTPSQIIDRGRGPQLSTSRITVLDLVPYFQAGANHEEIRRWLPTLTYDEISLAQEYYRSHQTEMDEKDRRAREHREEQIRQQHIRFPVENRDDKLKRLETFKRQW